YVISIEAPEIKQAISRLEGGRPHREEVSSGVSHHSVVSEFMVRESFNIVRASKDKRQIVDVRRYTKHLEADTTGGCLRLVTEISPNGGVKPVEVVAAVYGLTEEERVSLSSRIKRTRLYLENEVNGRCALGAQPGT
ncbi:MAG TPA: hypothetical protein VI756_17240, partial [Blastocatellia bacterium]